MSVSVTCLRSQILKLSVYVACLQTRCRQRLSADKTVCVRLTLVTVINQSSTVLKQAPPGDPDFLKNVRYLKTLNPSESALTSSSKLAP